MVANLTFINHVLEPKRGRSLFKKLYFPVFVFFFTCYERFLDWSLFFSCPNLSYVIRKMTDCHWSLVRVNVKTLPRIIQKRFLRTETESVIKWDRKQLVFRFCFWGICRVFSVPYKLHKYYCQNCWYSVDSPPLVNVMSGKHKIFVRQVWTNHPMSNDEEEELIIKALKDKKNDRTYSMIMIKCFHFLCYICSFLQKLHSFQGNRKRVKDGLKYIHSITNMTLLFWHPRQIMSQRISSCPRSISTPFVDLHGNIDSVSFRIMSREWQNSSGKQEHFNCATQYKCSLFGKEINLITTTVITGRQEAVGYLIWKL